MSNLFDDLRASLRNPDHWVYASWLDNVTHYRRTYLGILWALVPTVLYIWGIGGFLGGMQPGSMQAYLGHVGVGFVVFRLIMVVFSDATSVFASYRSYIYDGNVRLTDFILRSVNRSLIYFVLVFPLLAIAALGSPEFVISGVPASLLGMLALVLNLFVYSVLLSLLGARFPDLSELMGSLMMAAFLLTPIMWDPASAPEGTVRGMLMRANPFHHLLAGVRAPLLGETIEPLTVYYLIAMSVIGAVGAHFAYRAFARRVPVWL